MPEAEPFSTRGFVGAGVPFCIESLDVSNYTYVNELTLEQAFSLYYNIYSVNIEAGGIVYNIVTTDNPETEGDESYSETVDWVELSDPATEPEVSITPFTVGTDHYEQETEYQSGIYDLDDTSDYDEVEPKFRVCSSKSAERVKYSGDTVTSVFASFGFSAFKKLYDGVITDESNHIGYGFPMGVIQMHCGIAGLEANGISYGNFAEDGDFVPDPLVEPNWWSVNGGYYGDPLTGEAVPDTVGNDTIDGIPFLIAEWSGRDAGFSVGDTTITFTVTPLAESDTFDFYTYPGP